MRARIAVVGAGIGGLTAALGLLRAGFDVTVHEQAPELGEVGAGLTLTSGALHCLDFLGLLDDVERQLARPRATPFLHYRTGEVLAEGGGGRDDRTAADRYDPGHIFRADFHALLVAHVRALAPDAIVLGRELVGLEQDAERVVLRFADGSSAFADALIGCDGVRSVVRAQLFGDDAPTFSGKIAYRFLLPYADARPHLGASDITEQYVGPGRVFMRYPISGHRLLNCVGLAASDRWIAEGWSQPATREELLEEFAGWHPDVVALMAMAPPDRLIKWGIFERPARERWSVGRATLLGDAAHPMPPFLGLGATTAIEDGTILGRAFAESAGVGEALARYEAARVPRANRAFEASKLQGAIFDRIDPANYPPADAPAHDPSFQRFDPREVVLA